VSNLASRRELLERPYPEHLQLFAGLPQTVRVFFNGSYHYLVIDVDLTVFGLVRWKWV
jgi:hypothetical protein